MATMANIVVKKADGTTDITFTTITASGGDKSPAVWRSNSIGTAAGFRPELRVTSRTNGTLTARRIEGSFSYPSLFTEVSGRVIVSDRFNITFSGLVPNQMVDSDLSEASAQFGNLMASALMKEMVRTGYAAT